MSSNRCFNCFRETDSGICPWCGYDNGSIEETNVLKAGSILHGKYMVGRVLGQGGFGITYAGFDMSLEARVAIKEYFPPAHISRNNSVSNALVWSSRSVSREDRETGCAGFLKEARKMAKLMDIPEIVRVLEVFNENDTAYIVMEYVEGQTLKDKLAKEGVMSFESTVRLLMPLIKAIDAAHGRGMIHRDISPDNIMLQSNGMIRLLDFGAAKDLNLKNATLSMKVAKSGFSPFEQYGSNGVIGPWTDVYAMCATIYYCVTGRTIPDAADRMDGSPLIFPEGAFTAEQKAVLEHGLAVTRGDRVQTMARLGELLTASVNSVNSRKEPAPTKSGKAKGGKKLIAVLALAAACLAVGIFLAAGRNSGPEADRSAEHSNLSTEKAQSLADVFTPTPSAAPSEELKTPEPPPESSVAPTETEAPVKEYEGDYSGYSQLYFDYAEASSCLLYNGEIYYATNAIDGIPETSWQEGAEGYGIGEYLELYFADVEEVSVLKLRLGDAGRADWFENNGKPRRVLMEFSDGSAFTYEFPVRNSDYAIIFREPIRTDRIKLTIKSVYEGNKWEDTAISEVTAYGVGSYRPPADEPQTGTVYSIQVGFFKVYSNAQERYDKAFSMGFPSPEIIDGGNGMNKVVVGRFATRQEAEEWLPDAKIWLNEEAFIIKRY